MATTNCKTCTKCGVEKPLEDFYSRNGKPIAACKTCTRSAVSDYQKRNREKKREWDRAFRQRNPGSARERQRKWRHGAGREKYLARRKRFRDRNKDKLRREWAEWYAANGEARLARKRAEYDPEKKRTTRKPEQGRKDRERRRARMLDAYVEDTPFDVVLQRDCGICGICNQPIMENTIELDHIVPLAAGGMHEMKNVQLAHRTCNRRKWVREGLPDLAA